MYQRTLSTIFLFAACGYLGGQTFAFGPPKPVATTSYSGVGVIQIADINSEGSADVLIPSAVI